MRAVPCWGIHYDILWELWINSIVDQSLTKPHRFVKVIDKSHVPIENENLLIPTCIILHQVVGVL